MGHQTPWLVIGPSSPQTLRTRAKHLRVSVVLGGGLSLPHPGVLASHCITNIVHRHCKLSWLLRSHSALVFVTEAVRCWPFITVSVQLWSCSMFRTDWGENHLVVRGEDRGNLASPRSGQWVIRRLRHVEGRQSQLMADLFPFNSDRSFLLLGKCR